MSAWQRLKARVVRHFRLHAAIRDEKAISRLHRRGRITSAEARRLYTELLQEIDK